MVDRPLPAPVRHEAEFWLGGVIGELRIAWCTPCAAWRHPSLEICPDCLTAISEHRVASGKATVLAVTVNHQRWVDGFDLPYAIAIVGLKEDPSIRLTTNITNMAPEAVRVGMSVRVTFLQQQDIWLPLFEPDPDEGPDDQPIRLDLPAPVISSGGRAGRFEEKVAFTGIGASSIGRKLAVSNLSLTIDACLAAIADAGLDRRDIDGICAYPGSAGLPGVSSGGIRAVEQILRINPVWHCGAHETPGQAGTVIDAMLAIASGLCRHVLCFTSFAEAVRPAIREAHGRIAGELAWRVPFGAASPANWIALYASQYFARFGADREMLGWIAINARRNAALNPDALYAESIGLDAYFNARLISSPFGLLDCDVPCDGAIAFVVSAIDAAQDLPHRPILVEAVGTQIAEPQSWDQGTLTHQANIFGPAAHLWTRTDLTPGDVDVALLYDGFTFNVVSWLEALGFCGFGEASAFLDGGRTIAREGALPLNPHGGHLCAGRTNGYGHLREAIIQLRGHAGERQISDSNVALVSNGGGIPASCMLLRQ
ncbi:MAG: OB-fold domain-containing protein [Novosphingobium sp.]